LVAGASGAVGRPLVPLLLAAGHEVVGTTRSQAKAAGLRDAGAEAAIVDATDPEALRAVVERARPEVVVNQLTALPAALNPRDVKGYLRETNLLRGEVGPALARFAADAGARRLVAQSVAFIYPPGGDPVKTEEDPPVRGEDETAFSAAADALAVLERSTLETEGTEGVVLRYGFFYGPGTYYARGGSTAEQVMRRRYPVIGPGEGVFSFVHVDDAAAATLAAIGGGPPGVYNVVDDEPAPMREWLPVYAEALGAKPPRRVPVWLAALIAGPAAREMASGLSGASNAKAKRELGWQPARPSWRQGFRSALG
jgi:nucleoside-diphosphate-sugar epimerase